MTSAWQTYRSVRAAYSRLVFRVISLGASGAFVYHAWGLGDPVELGISVALLCFVVWLACQFTKTVLAVTLLAAAGLGFGLYFARQQEANIFRPIAMIARNAALAHPNYQGQITLTGRVIIWDVVGDRMSGAYYALPYALRAKPDDLNITVFLIANVRSEFLGRYHAISSKPSIKVDAAAYRDTADFAVVRWPQQELLSWQSLAGAVPPAQMQFHPSDATKPVHGDWEGPFVQWVLALPGGLDAERMPLHQWTQAEAQAEAVRRYPQLGVAGSPLNRAFVEKYQSLKASNSSDLQDPVWPLRLTRKIVP
ncbi:MAG: hypothetical protein P4L99_15755 [Chthoniobacter sp.]|nr:hypothetical protein [Chthoniobacter sp.]